MSDPTHRPTDGPCGGPEGLVLGGDLDPDDLMGWARRYAELGLMVVPLYGVDSSLQCTCKLGTACKHAGKHPIARLAPHGVGNASRYLPTIERWFRVRGEMPMNLGIACGASGLTAVDIDPRHGGLESMKSIEAEHGPMPTTLTAITGGVGGEGRHLLYADPECRARTEIPYAGIDMQRRRKLIVVAPSLHESGRRYRWSDPLVPVAPLPEWLRRDAVDR